MIVILSPGTLDRPPALFFAQAQGSGRRESLMHPDDSVSTASRRNPFRSHRAFAAMTPARDIASVDIRRIPPVFWTAAVSGAFGRLSGSDVVEIVAADDPMEVWHLLEALLPGRFTWDYAERGPARWRVRVGRG
jgi:uncharacterized protein (DUF2249 family)